MIEPFEGPPQGRLACNAGSMIILFAIGAAFPQGVFIAQDDKNDNFNWQHLAVFFVDMAVPMALHSVHTPVPKISLGEQVRFGELQTLQERYEPESEELMATHTIDTISTRPEPARLLRRVLQTNAVFSAISGAGMLLASGSVARLLGVEVSWPIGLLGVDLLVFAAWVGYEAMQGVLRVRRARAVLALDIAWVVASALLIALDPLGLAVGGKWAVAAVADVVAVFALIEYLGLRRLRAQ